MGIGAVAEPLVVITLLIGGTWINRDSEPGRRRNDRRPDAARRISGDDVEAGIRSASPDSADGLLEHVDSHRSMSPSLLAAQESKWRKRQIGIFGYKKEVTTPNTRRFRGNLLSRLLERFPFLVECWYWALIYWV
jgi:hypothetical protein